MTKPCRYFWIFSLVINILGLIINIIDINTNMVNVILSTGYIAALLLIKVMMDGAIFKF